MPIDCTGEHILHGQEVSGLGNARQGIGYGKNKYRGSKQPFFIRNTYRYVFRLLRLTVFWSWIVQRGKGNWKRRWRDIYCREGQMPGGGGHVNCFRESMYKGCTGNL